MARKRSPRALALWALAALLAAACDNPLRLPDDVLFHQFAAVDAEGWDRADTVVIDVPPLDSAQQVQLALEVRALRNYPFRNLQLRLALEEIGPRTRKLLIRKTLRPDSTVARLDTIADTVQLAKPLRTDRVDYRLFEDPASPAPSGLTFVESAQTPYAVSLKAGTRYRLRITHAMRENPLRGITDIGIRLVRPAGNAPGEIPPREEKP